MNEPVYEVVWPSAPRAFDSVTESIVGGAAMPGEGRRIAFLWDYVFRGDEMFEIVREEIAAVSPDDVFIDHTEFGDIHGPDEVELLKTLPGRLEEVRAHAVIVGVGA